MKRRRKEKQCSPECAELYSVHGRIEKSYSTLMEINIIWVDSLYFPFNEQVGIAVKF
jgi:hypothetical protein